MFGWFQALHRFHIEEENDFTKDYEVDIKLCRDNGRDEIKEGEIANITSVKIVHRNLEMSYLNCTLRFYLTTGTIMVQGNGYKEWGNGHIPLLKTKVNEYVEYSNTSLTITPGSQNKQQMSTSRDVPPVDTDKQQHQQLQKSSTPKKKEDTDITRLKKMLLRRAHRINSVKEKEVTELCTSLDSSIADAHYRIDTIQQSSKDTEVRLERQMKAISTNVTGIDSKHMRLSILYH